MQVLCVNTCIIKRETTLSCIQLVNWKDELCSKPCGGLICEDLNPYWQVKVFELITILLSLIKSSD